MITQLRLKNFKCFKRARINLKPLTVFAGLNGSGKSSAIQALVCLKSMLAAEQDGYSVLNLKPEVLDLGKMSDVFYQFSSGEDSECLFSVVAKDVDKQYEVSFSFQNSDQDRSLNVIKVTADYLPSDEEAESSRALKSSFKQLKMLSAVRIGPRSTHQNSESNVRNCDMETDGRYAVALLSRLGNTVVPEMMRRASSSPKASCESLLDQVNLWLQAISPDVSVKVPLDSEDDDIELRFQYGASESRREFEPKNVGVGLSVVLPVLVIVLSAKQGDCLIIENPESDVHPQGQVLLARLFAQAAKAGVQIIVETHSDHVINGIRVAVKEKYIDHEGVQLVAFKHHRELPAEDAHEEQYSIVTEAAIDSCGVMSKELPDFLDEWGKQMDKLLDVSSEDCESANDDSD